METWFLAYKSANISETWQDWTKVTVEISQEILYTLSIGVKFNDLGGSLCTLCQNVRHDVIYF